MIDRLIRWVVPRYLRGPSQSWLFTALAIGGYRLMRSRTGRRELIDIGPVGKGQKIVIEHVSQSHTQQLKAEKQAKKATRVERRDARRAAKVERRPARVKRRQRRRDGRAAAN